MRLAAVVRRKREERRRSINLSSQIAVVPLSPRSGRRPVEVRVEACTQGTRRWSPTGPGVRRPRGVAVIDLAADRGAHRRQSLPIAIAELAPNAHDAASVEGLGTQQDRARVREPGALQVTEP